MKRIILTGSEGLIGKSLYSHLSLNHDVFCIDYLKGDDLSNPEYVNDIFKKEKVDKLEMLNYLSKLKRKEKKIIKLS